MLIASWNVNSINVRLPQVLAWLEANKVDILSLQETKTIDDKFPLSEFKNLGYHVEYFGEKTYNGVAIVSKTKPSAVQKGFKAETEPFSRRFIEARFGNLHLLNCYIPNGQAPGTDKYQYKLNWISMLRQHLDQEHKKDELLAIMGDFNVAPEPRDVYDPAEWEGQILFSIPERQAIHTLIDWGLIDTFRIFEKEGGHYSWWDYRQASFRRNLGLRIDHIWATTKLAQSCTRAAIDIEPRKLERPSDHAPVIAEFNI